MRENCFKGQATDWELYLSGFSYSFWVALLAAGAVVYAVFLAYRYAKSKDFFKKVVRALGSTIFYKWNTYRQLTSLHDLPAYYRTWDEFHKA